MSVAGICVFADEVGLGEIVTHKEHGRAGHFGRGVGEAVTEVQRCRMTALAEADIAVHEGSDVVFGEARRQKAKAEHKAGLLAIMVPASAVDAYRRYGGSEEKDWEREDEAGTERRSHRPPSEAPAEQGSGVLAEFDGQHQGGFGGGGGGKLPGPVAD
jgi:hypothetical protein